MSHAVAASILSLKKITQKGQGCKIDNQLLNKENGYRIEHGRNGVL